MRNVDQLVLLALLLAVLVRVFWVAIVNVIVVLAVMGVFIGILVLISGTQGGGLGS